LRALAGRDIPVTVYAVPDTTPEDEIKDYIRLDVERLLFYVPTEPESATLKRLDRLAEIAARFR
jgi:hypothetical protein